MAKIKDMKNADFNAIRNDINNALKAVGEKYGMSLKMGNIRYSHDNFSTKLEAVLVDAATGASKTVEQLNLEKMGKLYLGEKFDINTTYTFHGEKIQFWGIATRRAKYPIIYKVLTSGKMYKMGDESAKQVVDPTYKPMFNNF